MQLPQVERARALRCGTLGRTIARARAVEHTAGVFYELGKCDRKRRGASKGGVSGAVQAKNLVKHTALSCTARGAFKPCMRGREPFFISLLVASSPERIHLTTLGCDFCRAIDAHAHAATHRAAMAARLARALGGEP